MSKLSLISLLLGVLGLHWLLQRYVAKPVLKLGAALMYVLTIVILLSMGAWRFDGAGVNLVLVMSAVAACRHGWRFYKVKMNLAAKARATRSSLQF